MDEPEIEILDNLIDWQLNSHCNQLLTVKENVMPEMEIKDSHSINVIENFEEMDEIEMAQRMFQSKAELEPDDSESVVFLGSKHFAPPSIAIRTCPWTSDSHDWPHEVLLAGSQSLVLHNGDQREIKDSHRINVVENFEEIDEIEMAQRLFQNKAEFEPDDSESVVFLGSKHFAPPSIAIRTCPWTRDSHDWPHEVLLAGSQSLVLHNGDQTEITKVLLNSPLRFPFVGHLVDKTGELLYPQAATLFPTFHLAILDDQSVEQLTRLMPAMVHLQVFISHAPISVLPELASLLVNWAPTLQSLSVTIGDLTFSKHTLIESAFSTIVSNLRSLIQAINRKLRALQRLSLDIDRDLYLNYDELLFGGETRVPLHLSILGQLKQFYLRLGDCPTAPRFLLKQLEAYATEKLTTIELGGNFNWNWKEMANSRFAERFTLVPFNYSLTPEHIPFLPSFTNLTVYAFNWKQLHSLDLVIHLSVLSSLPHLQYLKMDFFSPVSHPLPRSYLKLPSLRSVTVLEMSIDLLANENHNHLHAFFWATLFPSVQILKVTHCGHFCARCFPDAAKQNIPDSTEVAPCLRQLLAPLRVLPSLRKIFYQYGSKSDCIVEFTPQGEFVCTHEYIG